jgi:hypothetical protein
MKRVKSITLISKQADQGMKQLTYHWPSDHFPTNFAWVRCQPKHYAEF